MERTTVDSSSIAEIGYDATSRTLEVAFRNGRIYQYLEVARSLHAAFIASDSKGKFLNENIRDFYRYVRTA